MAFYALQCFKKIIFFSRFIYKLSLKKCLHYYTHCYKITTFFIRNANCMDVQQKFLFQNLLSKKRFSFGKNGVSGMTKCVSFYVDEMPTNCEIIFQKTAETFPTVTQTCRARKSDVE